MNQRIFYIVTMIITAYLLLIIKPLPVNIHRIERVSEFEVRFKGSVLEDKEMNPSVFSELALVPDQFNSSCYSDVNYLTSNGLADRLGNRIGWQRIIQWNYDCDSDGQIINLFENVYSILISKNPMIAYPDFSNQDEKLTTQSGVEVLLTSTDYPYTISGKTTVYERVKYTFKVNDVYVFIEQTRLRDESNNDELLIWVEKLISEIQTVLN